MLAAVEKTLADVHQIVGSLQMQRRAAPYAGVAKEIAAIFGPQPRFFNEAAMFIRKMRKKFHANL